MTKISQAALLAAAFALAGCETSGTRMIRITSEPEGAPIIVDTLPLSKTPISLEVESTEDGCFTRAVSITALPQSPELHTQVVSYPAYSPSNPEPSRIPEEIHFNMRVSPAAEAAKK